MDPAILDPAFPPLLPARWHLTEALYTDGACETQEEGPNLLGAAVYVSSSDTTITIAPHGRRETNTITRAELAGIHVALDQFTYFPKPITVFCDSLAAIYETLRVVHMPHTLLYHKHYPMLSSIRSFILTRARMSLPTHVQKVKSHIGVAGNEHADAGAARALRSPDACDVDLADIDNAYLSSLPAWPCHPPPTPDGGLADSLTPDTCWFLGDLHSGVVGYLQSHASHLYDGPGADLTLYAAYKAVTDLAMPAASNHMWHASQCQFPLIRTILHLRYQQVWTASQALAFKRPYRTVLGPITSGRCPICPPSDAPSALPLDTVGHILGGCTHSRLKALYIARHNKALLLVHATFLAGDLSRSYVVLDATSNRRLPCGVSCTRVPRWALPHLSAVDVALMRPDFLLFDGLLSTDPALQDPSALLPSLQLATMQHTCRVLIMELGYTHERSHDPCLSRKTQQHARLVAELRTAGWQVYPQDAETVPVLLLGTCATVYQSSAAILRTFGISGSAIPPLLRSLHLHAVRFATAILSTRRSLERDPAHVTLILPPRPALNDPP